MIQRKPEKKCLERQEAGREDAKHVTGTTPPILPPTRLPETLKIGPLFT